MNRFRTRLPQLLGLWAVAAGAEGVLYYAFLSRPYFRGFFMPFAVAVLLTAVAGTWSLVRRREGRERRGRERRAGRRRNRGGAGQ